MHEHNTGEYLNNDQHKDTTNPENNKRFQLVINDDPSLLELPTENEIVENEVKILSDYDYLRITKEKEIEVTTPTIKMHGAWVAAPKNVTGISAAAKAGKTAFTGVLIAGAISKDGDIDGFDGIEIEPNPTGKAVMHFDTEQSDDDQQYFVKTILRRSGIDETPDYFRSYNIRQLSIDQYKDVTTNVCELCFEQFGGIHLIVIDGGADFITSVNDETKANEIVSYFVDLSIKYHCPVIVIVHLNPGSDKERGHFGSAVQRKCYGLLTIEKTEDISTAKAKIMRKAGVIPPVSFKYDIDKGYHVTVDAKDKDDAKSIKQREKVKTTAFEIFEPLKAYQHKDCISAIMQKTSKGKTTAKNMLENMTGWGYLIKGEKDGLYRINIEVK